MVSPDSDLGVDVKRDLDENGQDREGYHCVCPVHGSQRWVRSSSQSNTSPQDHLDVGGVFGFEDHLTLDLHRMADT
jgi:hypothetical protein